VWHLIMGIWLYFFLLFTLQVLHVYWMFLVRRRRLTNAASVDD